MEQNFYFNNPESTELTDRIFQLISQAENYIKTGNFFFQDPKFHAALLKAAKRGVAIFILSNLSGNENRSDTSARYAKVETDPHIPNLHELHRNGIHVRCNDNLHAKFLLCDGTAGLLMSANYTPNSLYGNPESGIDLSGQELADMEFVFDKLFTGADIKLSEDGKQYRYLRSENPLPADTFDKVGTASRLRLTAASKMQTNLAACRVRTLYDSIIDIIRKAKRELMIVSWSFNQVKQLPEFQSALQAAIQRGVDVHLYYNNEAEQHKVKRTETQLKELLGTVPFQRICHPFPYNHSKFVLSEQDGILFTANIDGRSGLTSGFELGCLLNKDQRNKALSRIKQFTTNGKQF